MTWREHLRGVRAERGTCRCVTPASPSAAIRSLTCAAGPISVTRSMKSSGSAAAASRLLAVEVEVLDELRLGLVALAAEDGVVEVAARGRPCRRCRARSRLRAASRAGATSPRPIARMPPPVICSGPSSGARLAKPAASAGPKTSCIFSGSERVRQPAVASSAVISRFFSPSAATQIGMSAATRVVDQLQRLAQPGALRRAAAGSCRCPSCSSAFAPPHLAADLDDLPGARDRLVVRHAVEALDHLRPGRAEPEDRPAARQRVEARGRHRHERRACGCRAAGSPPRSPAARCAPRGSP